LLASGPEAVERLREPGDLAGRVVPVHDALGNRLVESASGSGEGVPSSGGVPGSDCLANDANEVAQPRAKRRVPARPLERLPMSLECRGVLSHDRRGYHALRNGSNLGGRGAQGVFCLGPEPVPILRCETVEGPAGGSDGRLDVAHASQEAGGGVA